MAEKKVITEEVALQARGLFEIGRQNYKRVKEAELALCELLHLEDESYAGCISDQMYENDGSFDKGLKLEGFVVKKRAQR